MSKIIEALRHEHDSIGHVLDVLDSEIGYLTEYHKARDSDFELVWQAIDYFIDFPDLIHHPKEDMVFARLREIDPAAARDLGDLPASHAELSGELVDLAREVKAAKEDPKRARGLLMARARDFVRHQRQHMEWEEAQFFPVVERKLSEADWSDLYLQMIGRFNPLIGGPASERFEALRRVIANGVASKQQPAAPR